jgi:hypothetical protein
MASEIRAVTANVQCSISGGDGHISAELDSRLWGANGGKTQFFVGDSASAIVYMSRNVTVVGTFCASAGFSVSGMGGVGPNLKEESIVFNTPVASLSKPADSIGVLTSSFNKCGGFKHEAGTTLVKLDSWIPTLNPMEAPPYGHVFAVYTPRAGYAVFSGLTMPAITSSSYNVVGVIFGVATPLITTF